MSFEGKKSSTLGNMTFDSRYRYRELNNRTEVVGGKVH